jgi:hypothetical protein
MASKWISPVAGFGDVLEDQRNPQSFFACDIQMKAN